MNCRLTVPGARAKSSFSLVTLSIWPRANQPASPPFAASVVSSLYFLATAAKSVPASSSAFAAPIFFSASVKSVGTWLVGAGTLMRMWSRWICSVGDLTESFSATVV